MEPGPLLLTEMKLLTISALLICIFLVPEGATHDVLYIPQEGLVPNSEIAIQIADAILVGVFGEEIIKMERPLTAELRDGVWIVKGTLRKGRMGGVAYIYIKKRDGRILKLYHEQ